MSPPPPPKVEGEVNMAKGEEPLADAMIEALYYKQTGPDGEEIETDLKDTGGAPGGDGWWEDL